MIIARYITKEVLWTFIAITCLLLLIALSNRFAVYLAKAASGDLPIGLVFRVVGLYIPELLSYLIPLSFFIAILFAYGRLHADSEMTVLFACGVSWGYISRITLIMATVIMLITGILTLWLVPSMTATREKALTEGESFGMMQSLIPGRFQTLSGGKLVFYLGEVSSKEKRLKGVFIAERPTYTPKEGQGWALITAKEAEMKRDPKTNDFYLVLKDGYRYQGVPGAADYSVIQFKEYGRAVVHKEERLQSEFVRLKNSKEVLASKNLEDKAELQWRLSLPLSVLILGLLAVSLSRVRPRQGRFAKLLPAIVLYILYYNLFTISKRWVAAGTLSSIIGVWWVHLLFFFLALGLLAKESGWFWSKLEKRRLS